MNNNTKSRVHFDDNELISKFRVLIKESNINLSTSDELLMCFIHARKGDVHRAMKLLNNYVRMTKQHPELAHLCPLRVKHVLDLHFFASPHREQNGCRILLINLRKWDLRICSLEDVFLALVFCFQRLVSELDTQTNGIVLILDVKDLSLNHVRQFTPYWVKIIADIAQDVFPIRFQGIHVVNEPRIMKILVAIFWPFLSNKIRNRLFFHGQCFVTVHQHVDPACLPSDYNGCMKSMDTMCFSSVFSEIFNARAFRELIISMQNWSLNGPALRCGFKGKFSQLNKKISYLLLMADKVLLVINQLVCWKGNVFYPIDVDAGYSYNNKVIPASLCPYLEPW